jgi:hypothetical protein
MIGFLDLPVSKDQAKVYTFKAINASNPDSASYQGARTWNKPPGISFVYGLLIGAGSGGGGGGAGATAGHGGGGGAAGKMITFLQPACLVPDTLVVNVGVGGAGGAGGVSLTGQRGQAPSTETALYFNNVYVSASISLGTGSLSLTYVSTGNARDALLGGRGGGTPLTNQNSPGGINQSPLIVSQSGICGFSLYNIGEMVTSGAFGGSGSAGYDIYFAGYPQGGAGGGGINIATATSYNGGNVICPSTSNFSIWNRNLAGGVAPGGAGEHGITMVEPTLFTLPGAGGAGRNAGTGGRGGDGGIGCGGGGGGAGGSVGGAGGRGGDGLIILVCW